jgi:hypothetical protein
MLIAAKNTPTVKCMKGSGRTRSMGKAAPSSPRDVYVGAHQMNKKHGFGIVKFACPDVYEGHFVDLQYDGQGVFKFVDGRVYDGAWLNNKKHGFGVFTFENGGVQRHV